MGIERGLRELALFAGIGGGILGGQLLGWRTVCAVENDPYCIKTLIQRQADGHLSTFPIWDDVRTFNGRPWRGEVDVISGGFPCQDISAAGKGVGITGERSGLFFEMLRIIGEVRPKFVFSENSPHLRTKGLGHVVEGLSRLGYVGRVGVLGARHVGANHHRDRMWIVAANADRDRKRAEPINAKTAGASAAFGVAEKAPNPNGVGSLSRARDESGRTETSHANAESAVYPSLESGDSPDADSETVRIQSRWVRGAEGQKTTVARITDWWDLPRFAGVDDGDSDRLDRVRATGNAQVPAVAALAWRILRSTLNDYD